jgi:hypothetical protein
VQIIKDIVTILRTIYDLRNDPEFQHVVEEVKQLVADIKASRTPAKAA